MAVNWDAERLIPWVGGCLDGCLMIMYSVILFPDIPNIEIQRDYNIILI